MRKFRFIFIISVLTLSLALPCFATVTESSGDGYSVYGSRFYPDLPDPPYPYTFIYEENGAVIAISLSSLPAINAEAGTVILEAGTSGATSALLEGAWSPFYSFTPDVDETVSISLVVWNGFDVVVGDFTQPAIPVISLDGYTLINWDGDITGLDQYAVYYRVADFIDRPFSAYTFFTRNDVAGVGSYVGDAIVDMGSESWQAGGGSNAVLVCALSDDRTVSASPGLYFTNFSVDGTSVKVQTFAYRESETEGPTGAVIGLTISYPPVGESDFIAYAGSDIQCTATVTGTGDFNPAVTWSVQYSAEYNPDVYPTISETGLLHLPATMLEQRIVVVATSVEDPTIGAIVPIYIMPPAVSSVTITPSSATAAPGQNVQFSATVSGSNVVDSAVTWAVGGASSASTRITVDGLLLIGSDEVSPVIAVRATSNQDSSVYSTALVNINVPAVVTGVTITPDDIVLNRGDMQQFTATVSGTGSFDSSVTWQITSVYSAGTSITNNGLLTVSNEQKYDYIIIKATSTADPTKSAVAYVFVEDAVSDPMNIDLSVLERLLSQIEQYTKSIQYMLSYQNWFREFDFTTGQLSTQEDYIVGLVPNFYRFMQNMEQYVGQLAYRTASGSELNSRNEFTNLWDQLFAFQKIGQNVAVGGAGVSFKDTGDIFNIFTNLNSFFDTGYGIDDLWDLISSNLPADFLSPETAFQLNPLASTMTVGDDDPYNMHYYYDHIEASKNWRDKR